MDVAVRALGKKKKDLANLLSRGREFRGDPPVGVFEFLNRLVKEADDQNVPEARGLYLIPEVAKEPLKGELLSLLPSKQGDESPAEASSYLENVQLAAGDLCA